MCCLGTVIEKNKIMEQYNGGIDNSHQRIINTVVSSSYVNVKKYIYILKKLYFIRHNKNTTVWKSWILCYTLGDAYKLFSKHNFNETNSITLFKYTEKMIEFTIYFFYYIGFHQCAGHTCLRSTKSGEVENVIDLKIFAMKLGHWLSFMN